LPYAFSRRSRALLPFFCVLAATPYGVAAESASRNPGGANAALPQAPYLVGKPGDTLSQLVAGVRVGSRDKASAPGSEWVTSILHHRQQSLDREQLLAPRRARSSAPPVMRRAVAAVALPDAKAPPLPRDHRKHLVHVQSGIEGSFLQALLSGGVPEPLAHDLIRALGHELDLQRELRPGDNFSVLFERFRADGGGFLRDGKVLHASFRVSGRDFAIWRHETPDGADWFDAEGRSLRREFLRTPLDGARITSGFGMRHHPISGFTRMHQGVDFAAPVGTPVVAAADGTVVAAGPRNAYGRAVELRHPGGTETLYAHLSSFAPGLAPGQQVRQGQLIGRVGSSGLSSGPHLHYETLQDGRPVNPATVRSAGGVRLAGTDLANFQATQRPADAWLSRIGPMQALAMAE